MGSLYHGWNSAPLKMPDRVLAHLKVLIATKLRRGESFTITWEHAEQQVPGRTSIWLQPSIPLRFVFDSREPEELDSRWMQELARAANNGAITLSASQLRPFEVIVEVLSGD